MANSSSGSAARKPHPDYPLTPRRDGRWCKKVKGRPFIFCGTAEEALDDWRRVKDDLLAGRTPGDKDGERTVVEICDRFLVAKKIQVDAGELKQLSWNDYKTTCDRIVAQFGRTRAVTSLRVEDFEQLKASIVKTRGPVAIRGLVRDAKGNPVARAVVHGANGDGPNCRSSAATDEHGRFLLGGLSPHAAATITALTDGGGMHASLAAEPEQPWERTRWVSLDLVLQPTVALSGRVTYAGKPRAGVRMKLRRTLGDNKNRYYDWGEVVTGADGKYRVNGLSAGDGYMFEVHDPNGFLSPDWHHQSPYVQHIPAGKREIELPDVNLVSRGQSLRGVVVDPQGRPVSGITVSASLADGRMLSRPPTGPVPWTSTGGDGRFELSQLPDEPIKLMAYRANAQGGRIRFPAKALPALNQQDVRIVLDPRLTDEVEDLDAPKRP